MKVEIEISEEDYTCWSRLAGNCRMETLPFLAAFLRICLKHGMGVVVKVGPGVLADALCEAKEAGVKDFEKLLGGFKSETER